MKILKILLAVSLIVIALPACSRKPSSCIPGGGVDALKLMVISKAEVDAVHAYAAGDHRLIGIHSGMGLMVPELTGNPDLTPYKIKIFEVADESCNAEEHEVKNDFVKYADKYNKKMIAMLNLGDAPH
jgi:hypothetical protein